MVGFPVRQGEAQLHVQIAVPDVLKGHLASWRQLLALLGCGKSKADTKPAHSLPVSWSFLVAPHGGEGAGEQPRYRRAHADRFDGKRHGERPPHYKDVLAP